LLTIGSAAIGPMAAYVLEKVEIKTRAANRTIFPE
jgi:hypothetical protein